MKTHIRILLAALILVFVTGCDAFKAFNNTKGRTSQGKPYELIVVCNQQQWDGALGDTLRSILTAPISYLNQTEPLFDVMRTTERGFTGLVADHRNILKVVLDRSLPQTNIAVQYDVSSEPQIVLTLQGPSTQSLIGYVSENRTHLVQVLELAERNRAVAFAEAYSEMKVAAAVKKTFGVEMTPPQGYVLAKEESNFIWARFEYPTASQGFFIYSYPYNGPQSMTAQALLAARNQFAARIPGPAEGSYMTTTEAFEPELKMFRLEGRLWWELRGFWDVKGDFMGGPFVSYTTIDTQTNRVFTLDCYVFSPKLHKRNFMRGVEHLLYTVHFPDTPSAPKQ